MGVARPGRAPLGAPQPVGTLHQIQGSPVTPSPIIKPRFLAPGANRPPISILQHRSPSSAVHGCALGDRL